jgi:mono/diheme cytochrome c family protein
MDEQQKQEYLEGYKKAKEKGVPFFPDAIFKDAVVSLVIFLILVALAYFIGAPLEERANPADANYTPRPEWYFLFLFQLLKYFPGNLEVIGVFVLPSLVVILLIALPFIDRSPFRHFLKRPWVTGITVIFILGVVFLSVRSVLETPPPVAAASGDQTADLYLKNCAPCHGPSIAVPAGINLHDVIAEGKHEGMPAWSGDLTTDQIDALAGFILSPGGSKLFTDNCADCHEVAELVASDPVELKKAINQGQSYPPHAEADVPDWSQSLSGENQAKLLNFLVAPDGQRLFAVNCSPCHGKAVSFSGSEDELRTIISQGGMHLEMPSWQAKLSESEIDVLARYVTEPASVPEGQALFEKNCSSCHGERIPLAESAAAAKEIITKGGEHQTMPVWGQVLTPEQLDALVTYSLEATQGTSVEVGQELFSQNCAPCHGQFGEGGPNPTREGDIIAPISTGEYLKTRDDFTLREIIDQGQPNFGMSPFGSAYGGPLDGEEVDAIVAFIRSWQDNPPVELPPEVQVPARDTVSLDTSQIYADLCAQCHGPNGEGGIGPSFQTPQFQATRSDQQLFNAINLGHPATSMIGWGDILSQAQIQSLVELIRTFKSGGAAPTTEPGVVSFSKDVMPIFEENCTGCHGTLGGWDATSYQAVMQTGDHAPVVIPGDVPGSLLAQKIQGTHTEGNIMPPAGKMPEATIQLILDWIAAGAADN